MDNSALIYGKNSTERIISLEVEDSITTIFVQEEDGSISKHKSNNRFWVLSNEELNKNFKRMRGELHYKWGALVETKQEFYQIKNRYGNDKDLFCVYNDKESCMLKDGFTYYKGLKHDEISILAFDIETTGLTHDRDSKVLIISNTFRDCFGNIERKLFCYDDYIDNPANMFLEWASWVNKINPSIIVGHNIYNFDFPYLDYCAKSFNVELRLGREERPIKFSNYISKFRKDSTQFIDYKKCQIYGREIVDTMFLSIKYDVGRKYTSYGLKSIIKEEGLEVENRQFYDAGQIRYKYKDPQEWSKIKAYAEFDADDALSLFDLMAASFFYMSQSVPKSFQEILCGASGSQLNSIMIRAYLQNGHSLPKASSPLKYEGAISIGNPGIYREVLKIDINSLYPSIMIQFNIYDQDKDPKAYFPSLVKYFTEERLKNKKLAKETNDKYYDDLQNSQKIFANSLYGFLGSSGLLFNSPKNAALITEKGREILNFTIKWATNA